MAIFNSYFDITREYLSPWTARAIHPVDPGLAPSTLDAAAVERQPTGAQIRWDGEPRNKKTVPQQSING